MQTKDNVSAILTLPQQKYYPTEAKSENVATAKVIRKMRV